jgi:cobalt-zinc-cadmium efflux system membrane fusion protein
MTRRGSLAFKIILLLVVLLLLASIPVVVALPSVQDWWKRTIESAKSAEKDQKADGSETPKPQPAELSGANGLLLRPATVEALGIRTELVKPVTKGLTLELPGSLAPDTDRLVPIRSRFAGELVELGEIPDDDTAGPTKFRPISTGDKVQAGQLLAVVWCKDLGEKKSELVDAVSKLKLDQDTLKRLREVSATAGAIPEQSLRQAERDVAASRIAVTRADLTLRSWRLTDEEIDAIYKEADKVAERVRRGEKGHDKEQERNWARVEVRAPFDGTILEKNFAKGAIVDTGTNLYMLGDLSRLSAFANVFEEDLPALQALPRPIAWTIQLKAEPQAKPLKGFVSEIRPLVDPTMHAALVRGRVDNPDGKLLSGQFVTARVQLPPPAGEVEIPTRALIEDGQESIVFVQPDPQEPNYVLRRVAVTRRTRETVHIRSEPDVSRERSAAEPLRPGERVLVAGTLVLRATLKDLQDAAKAAAK